MENNIWHFNSAYYILVCKGEDKIKNFTLNTWITSIVWIVSKRTYNLYNLSV